MTNGNDDDDDGDEKDADDQDRDEEEQDEGEWTKTSAHTLLFELLESGGWRGAGWKAYIDRHKLQDDAVHEAASINLECDEDE